MEKGGVNWSKMVKNFFTSAADGKGGKGDFLFLRCDFLLETEFPGSLRSQTGVWERGAKLEFGNEGQNKCR